MVEENKKLLIVENEVVKKPTQPEVPWRSPNPSTIQARQCLTSVIRRERVCSSWYCRRHGLPFGGCYCFATFRPTCQEPFGYCFVLCDGKGSSEGMKKIKRFSK